MQTDQKTLAMALKTAPEAIQDKVMKNMSERVRAALAEEMEFLSEVPNAKAEAARKEITSIIRTQDKEGTLVWLEA
jgi:flagellar motor switch protein FliG